MRVMPQRKFTSLVFYLLKYASCAINVVKAQCFWCFPQAVIETFRNWLHVGLQICRPKLVVKIAMAFALTGGNGIDRSSC